MSSIRILSVRIDMLTMQMVVNLVRDRLAKSQKTVIATVNPEFIMQAQSDGEFKDQLEQSDLAVADGIGLLWAARLEQYRTLMPSRILKLIELFVVGLWLGVTTLISRNQRQSALPEQITGVDLSVELCRMAAEESHTLFLLGEKEGVAENAAKVLRKRFPNLKIVGTFAGNGDAEGDEEVLRVLSKQDIDILLVAYGAPKQEKWIRRNFAQSGAKVAIGVGGTFLFISGEVRRAPELIRSAGLEWLYRLITQPWRWRRQLALPRFILCVIWSKA